MSRRGKNAPGPARNGPSGLLLLAAVFLAAALPFAPSVSHDFTYDDHEIVERNPAVAEWGRWRSLLWDEYWPGTRSGLYRPVTLLSFAVGRQIHGMAPAGFHAVNVLLHAAVCCMVLVVARTILRSWFGALGAALLFAVHPLHSEAVCGVVGRAELLATLLALVSFRTWNKAGPAAPAASGVAAALVFLLALGSKENVIVLPLLLLLHPAAAAPAGSRLYAAATGWRRFALPAACAAGFLALRATVLGGWRASFSAAPPFVENPLAHLGAAERVLQALAHQARGLALHVLPHPLIADYSYRTLTRPDSGWSPAAAAFLAFAAAAAGLWLVRSGTAARAAFGLGWYLLAVLPAGNLLFPAGTVFAERLFYFPSVGLCIAVGALLEAAAFDERGRWRGGGLRERLCLGSAGAWVLALLLLTVLRVPDWRNDLALFDDTVRKAPENVKARLRRGDARVLANRPGEAIEDYVRALQIRPEYGPAAANMMVPLMKLGRWAEAIRYGERARELLPEENAVLLVNLASAYLEHGDEVRFFERIRRAVEVDPGSAAARLHLGLYYLRRTTDREAARRELGESLRLDPGQPNAEGIRATLKRLR